MSKIKLIFRVLFGILAFLLIWLVLLALSPFMLAIILGQFAFDAIFKKKVDKPKTRLYVPATKDNDIHSAN